MPSFCQPAQGKSVAQFNSKAVILSCLDTWKVVLLVKLVHNHYQSLLSLSNFNTLGKFCKQDLLRLHTWPEILLTTQFVLPLNIQIFFTCFLFRFFSGYSFNNYSHLSYVVPFITEDLDLSYCATTKYKEKSFNETSFTIAADMANSNIYFNIYLRCLPFAYLFH